MTKILGFITFLFIFSHSAAAQKNSYSLEEALQTPERIEYLDLSSKNLTEVPRGIGALTHLKTLDLSNNQLTTLPEEIGQLIHLEKLILNKNNLTRIPESILNLKELKDLRLDKNQISTLPKKIDKLAKLEKLTLRDNRLSVLPKSFYNLLNLKELDLTSNTITQISKDISKLQSLTVLQLQFNPLKELPEKVGNLASLETLWLNKTELSSLPHSIGKLSNLKDLSAGYNHLKSIPATITALKNLESLSLEKNLISSLPADIGNLTKLKRLNLNTNKLTSIPASLGNLKLSALYLKENDITELPEAVIAMGCYDIEKDPQVYYPSRAQLMVKDRKRLKAKREKKTAERSLEEKQEYAELERIRLEKLKEEEKFRLYHNVVTDALRMHAYELSQLAPFSSNIKYKEIVISLEVNIDRYNVSEYITPLNYLMYLSEIPDNFKTIHSLSNTEIINFKNISHLAAHALADSYLSAKNYPKAIEYLNLALVDYPYHSFSGTTVNKDRLRIRTDLAKSYSSLNTKNIAFLYLLANTINSSGYGDYDKLIKEYAVHEDKKQLKEDIAVAAETIKIHDDGSYDITFRGNTHTFFDGPYTSSKADMKIILASIALE
ncbi:leucine-rich repeat domain-containing protein [Cellulophaga sp. E16_2]|uniref:leucine-rich repeat domain-containing protein n=1 Tax=Cellulophaga sp. E16_2 TaxID=2789297 RepID=UPI001A92F3BC|nr:leucine-rich repeat domain-containing protein [Cellulophaga sp. E16_2]MBO0592504.1 leucine-rich repeat domain-containing protein [Cellulophaga sp. E16_2]